MNPSDDRCPVTATQVSTYEGIQEVVAGIGDLFATSFDEGLVSLRAHEACGFVDLTIQLFALTWRRGLAEADPGVRSRYVGILVNAASHDDPLVARMALRFLLSFEAPDLDPTARQALVERVVDDENGVEVLRVVAKFGLEERHEELQRLAGLPADRHAARTQGWTALLALARMGDPVALQRVLESVSAEADIVTRATILFDDLAFTRQPAAFDLLRTRLQSDARLPSLKPEGVGEPEALHAARHLLAHVDGGPFDPTALTEADLPAIRTWADAQTTWRLR
jgi:hypothetical protein